MSIPEYKPTPLEAIPLIREDLGKAFKSGKARPVAFRKDQLLSLAYLVKDNLPRLKDALAADLGRPHLETDILESGPTLGEIKQAFSNVAKWAKTESAPFSLNYFAMKPKIRKEPKGVVLVIVPFNYPILLSLSPLAGAIAAGNACVIKPSELCPAFSALLAELVPQYLDNDLYRVVNGAIPETTKLLELQWDHILFTGSGRIARIVLAAAAKTLSPVSTELGGKSPCIIDPGCDLKTAARRIMWGKTANAGQTCTAPDYVIVPKSFQDTFVKACVDVLKEFYPKGAENSDSYSRVISTAHTERIKSMIENTKGKIAYGGASNVEKKFCEPTIVTDVQMDDSTMTGEIFGPVLPVIPVETLDDAIDLVNSRDHPLALYVFTKSETLKQKVFNNTQSGGALANEVVLQVTADGIPFGGIGPSGSGSHTGKYTFDMFTHLHPTLDNPSWLDYVMGGRFPPFTVCSHKTSAMFFDVDIRIAAIHQAGDVHDHTVIPCAQAARWE
ncbi:NAD-aldehyde dehydrogenase [Amylostereum chailletii]|nr:NAD-aldehyde dehydrogenase [Amylostereum chailletii]